MWVEAMRRSSHARKPEAIATEMQPPDRKKAVPRAQELRSLEDSPVRTAARADRTESARQAAACRELLSELVKELLDRTA